MTMTKMAFSQRLLKECFFRHTVARRFNHLSLTQDAQSKVALLALNRKPVNSMNLEVLTEITTAIDKLETERQIKGLIITSELKGVFSGGLDIKEMAAPSEERLARFWRQVQEVWLRVYSCPLATVAAINGNSPAGGCLLALMCDYRVMAEGKYIIGLNETQLGITPPFWIGETMERAVGRREAERGLSLGLLYSADDALRRGLIDQLVPEEQVLSTAQQEIQRWLQIPDAARRAQKQMLREQTINRMLARRDEDVAAFCHMILSAPTQANITRYLDALSARAAKKKTKQ